MIVALLVITAVLAVAVVFEFAMIGDLASRLGSSVQSSEPVSTLRRLIDLDRGRVIEGAPFDVPDQVALIILSTVCTTCGAIASDLPHLTGQLRDAMPLRIVVSTPRKSAGDEFVRQHGLGDSNVWVDDRGDWCREALGVSLSPAVLLVEAGVIRDGYLFTAVDGLAALLADNGSGVFAPPTMEA